MKKILLTLTIVVIAQFSYAQFGTNGGNTTTMDNVGIGTSSPGAKLEIWPASSAAILRGGRRIIRSAGI